MTRHEYDLVQRYRDLGGNLAFLSANNFFWEVRLEEGRILRRTRLWRSIGRPESALIGVQYRANNDGRHPAPLRGSLGGNGTVALDRHRPHRRVIFGEELGGYGIEIDQATTVTPPGTILLADILDLYGPSLTAQMTYYETAAGAKVFAGGAIDFGGSAMLNQGASHAGEPGPALPRRSSSEVRGDAWPG